MNLRGIWERVGIRPWKLAALLVGFAIALFVVPPLVQPYPPHSLHSGGLTRPSPAGSARGS